MRRSLPIGFLWGEEEGQVLFDPNEAVTNAVRTVFQKFAETGFVRQVWIWFRTNIVLFPSRPHRGAEIRWIPAMYHAIHTVLTNPVYAGVYRYGRTRQERYVDNSGQMRTRIRCVPPSQWHVLLRDHHHGFIDWETYEMNQARLAANTRPVQHTAGGALREGAALLQGLAICGRCGRILKVYYQGNNSTPGYHCPGTALVNGRAGWCLRIGGVRVDHAVADAFLEAITPAGIDAALDAERQIEADRDAASAQLRLQVEPAQYEVQKAERRYLAVEPENRLVARNLETDWEKCLGELAAAKRKLENHQRLRPHQLSEKERNQLRSLGTDLKSVWSAPTTAYRDRKELLRALLEEVCIAVERRSSTTTHVTLRWRGGAITELDVIARCPQIPAMRILCVSRPTVLQRVKHGQLDASDSIV